jgi:type I restriction enzyme R subunit
VSRGFFESVVEDLALAWLEALGYGVLYRPDIAAGEAGAEHSDQSYRNFILEGPLSYALEGPNLDLSPRPTPNSGSLRATGAATFIGRAV